MSRLPLRACLVHANPLREPQVVAHTSSPLRLRNVLTRCKESSRPACPSARSGRPSAAELGRATAARQTWAKSRPEPRFCSASTSPTMVRFCKVGLLAVPSDPGPGGSQSPALLQRALPWGAAAHGAARFVRCFTGLCQRGFAHWSHVWWGTRTSEVNAELCGDAHEGLQAHSCSSPGAARLLSGVQCRPE